MDVWGVILTIVGILVGGLASILVTGFIIEGRKQIAQFFRHWLTKDGRRRRLAARSQKLHAKAMAESKNQRQLVQRNRDEAEIEWLKRFLESHGVNPYGHLILSSLSSNELNHVRHQYRQAYRKIVDPPKPERYMARDMHQLDHEFMVARTFGLDQDKTSVTITGRIL